MLGRSDLGKSKAPVPPEMRVSTPEPSTPQPSSERETMAGLLHKYLSDGLCEDCNHFLKERIAKLVSSGILDAVRMPDNGSRSRSSFCSAQDSLLDTYNESSSVLASSAHVLISPTGSSEGSDSNFVIRRGRAPNHPSPMASRESAQRGEVSSSRVSLVDCDDLIDEDKMSDENRLSFQLRENLRFSQVRRKKDFCLMERVEGRMVNVLEGLELHTGVFNLKEQKKIVDCVYTLQKLGETKKLIGRTYSRPKKWMRGKGRVTLQFGCCYNYAVDKDGNPPGIVQDEEVDPLPSVFKTMIRRMVRWHVLPSSCIPNSCIVNIYDEGDCIPPHIDHHDFLRPFCTVSFLSECNILFGSNLRVAGPGDFTGPAAIPLPVGSVLILNGNGADVAKHCVPGVPTKRISITFRKMDDSRLPYKFSPDDLDLKKMQPLPFSPVVTRLEKHVPERNQQQHILSERRQSATMQHDHKNKSFPLKSEVVVGDASGGGNKFHLLEDDFPPLGGGGSSSTSKSSKLKRPT